LIRTATPPTMQEPCIAVQLFGEYSIEQLLLKKKCCKKFKKKGKKACKSCPTHWSISFERAGRIRTL